MGKRTKGLNRARGFGPRSLAEEENMTFQIVSSLAFKLSVLKLAEIDTTKTAIEWRDWAMSEAAESLKAATTQREFEELLRFLP